MLQARHHDVIITVLARRVSDDPIRVELFRVSALRTADPLLTIH